MCVSQGDRGLFGGEKNTTVMFWELPESTGSECLGSMTPETQDIYLRMDHHRRRSGYRLGRIIARQQLLKKIAGGRRLVRRGVTVQAVSSVCWLQHDVLTSERACCFAWDELIVSVKYKLASLLVSRLCPDESGIPEQHSHRQTGCTNVCHRRKNMTFSQ